MAVARVAAAACLRAPDRSNTSARVCQACRLSHYPVPSPREQLATATLLPQPPFLEQRPGVVFEHNNKAPFSRPHVAHMVCGSQENRKGFRSQVKQAATK